MTTVVTRNEKIDGIVKSVDKKSGIATVALSNACSIEVFLPAFFGGTFAPYPDEGTHLKMRIVNPGAGSVKVVEAWADAKTAK